MADNADRLNHARQVDGLVKQPGAIDRAGSARPAFDKASDELRAKQLSDLREAYAARQQSGSSMVARQAPAPRPKPPAATGRDVDRQAHNEQLASERAQAARQKLSEAYRERAQQGGANENKRHGHGQKQSQR